MSDNYAVKARISREVYEHHEAVIRARANLGQDYGNVNQSTGDNGNRVEIADDAVYVGGSAGIGGTEQVNNDPASYSIGAERDGAEKLFQELYKEQIETDKRIHLDDYRMNQGRSKQGGLSYSQNRKGNYNGQCPSVSIIHNYDNNHKRGGKTPESVCPLYFIL